MNESTKDRVRAVALFICWGLFWIAVYLIAVEK
jgi:hypothetical protein